MLLLMNFLTYYIILPVYIRLLFIASCLFLHTFSLSRITASGQKSIYIIFKYTFRDYMETVEQKMNTFGNTSISNTLRISIHSLVPLTLTLTSGTIVTLMPDMMR